MYLTYKALHLIFMVAWFAGLFYMPRLFVYHVDVAGTSRANRLFKTMEKRLYCYIATPAMLLTWIFGLLMLLDNPGMLATGGWVHLKLVLVLLLTGYHISLNTHRKKFRDNVNLKSEEFFRWYNEVPTVFLIVIILLAVLRPF